MSAGLTLTLIEGKPYSPDSVKRRNEFEERLSPLSIARYTAGRIDALVLKIPALLFVGALQSAKILLKTAVCALTLNQCQRVNKFWSYSGVENDVARLAANFVSIGFAVKDVILAPPANYMISGVTLLRALRSIFSGEYHDTMLNKYKGDSKIIESIELAITHHQLIERGAIKP